MKKIIGKAIWFTGLPGSGKSTIAREVKKKLRGWVFLRLDEVRKKYVPKPKYTASERDYVYKMYGEEGLKLIAKGKRVIFDATAHKLKYRNFVRNRVESFVEVYVRCPLKICIERESARKQGLVIAEIYKKALIRKRTGKRFVGLGKVIGVDVPYEVNKKAEIVVDSSKMSAKQCAGRVVHQLHQKN